MSNEELLTAMGAIPSGIFILTVKQGDQETGMLASWVMQAGFEPPSLTVAVRKDRYVAEWLGAGAAMVINIVSSGDGELLKHFGRGFEPGEEAFEGLEIRRNPAGVAVLNAAMAHLSCVPGESVDSGDHRIFVAEVTGGERTSGIDPRTHVRKTGAHY